MFETDTCRRDPAEDEPFALAATAIVDRRRVIHAAGSILIEDSALAFERPLGADYSPDDQFAFPYFGAFGWKVGTHSRLVDVNSVLMVVGGEEFFETHPIPGIGHGSAILTPGPALLDELRAQSRCARHVEHAAVTRPMSDRAKLLTHRLVFGAPDDPLMIEEMSLCLLTEAMRTLRDTTGHGTARVVERAKEMLHVHWHERLSLEQIAQGVGVSPVYLTQAFGRSQGMPLYRYQTRLRLSRALHELPRCDSITGLALDLGFSSHSHFTTVFGAHFGVTPSAFRAAHRCAGGQAQDDH